MNNVTLMGRLTRDPELRYAQGSNMAVARFSLAVDKNLAKDKKQEMESKGQPTADFINCVAFGKIAETIAKYTAKGLRVLVNGRIQTGSYQDKDSGKTTYTTDVLVSSCEFIDWANSNNSSYDDFSSDFGTISDDRIPF